MTCVNQHEGPTLTNVCCGVSKANISRSADLCQSLLFEHSNCSHVFRVRYKSCYGFVRVVSFGKSTNQKQSHLTMEFRIPMKNVISKGSVYNIANVVDEKALSPEYDVFFRVDGKLIGTHRERLAKLSPVFEAMFREEWNTPREIPMYDAPYEAFVLFVDFFNHGRVSISQDYVGDLMFLAHIYDVPTIIPHCIVAIHEMMSAENVMERLNLARTIDSYDVQQFCKQFICNNTEETLWNEVNKLCELSTLETILEMAKYRSCSERVVLNCCLVWATRMCQKKGIDENCGIKLRTELGDCFALIRWDELDRAAFESVCKGPLHEIFSQDEVAYLDRIL